MIASQYLLDPAIAQAADVPVAKAALIDIDATLFVLLGLFLLLYVILRVALFRPVLRVFDEREKRIEGAKAEAREMQEKATTALFQYEAFLKEARAQGAQDREALRVEGQKLAREIVDAVRKETSAELAKGKAVLQAELATAQASIDREAAALAQQAATRLLGRPVRAIETNRTVQ